ncbi:MAG TPA: GDSL-type esterase/lipase family protein [Candidatus Angelobacter sp.]|nr:GDSL-type esterase/lipase family protein [Candidatus Angelobacter sp.]
MKAVITTLALALALSICGCGGSVAQPSSTSVPVTFYGDSLTAFWPLAQSFPEKPYKNDGTYGLTAVTLSSNFDSSVPPTHPDLVMILAGTNDVLQGDNAAHIFSTLTGMYDNARAQGIPFAVCTLPPMARSAADAHNAVIVDLNRQLRNYAAANQIPLADYYSSLVDPSSGELQAAFSLDNVHLTSAGYAAITPIAAKAIAAAR